MKAMAGRAIRATAATLVAVGSLAACWAAAYHLTPHVYELAGARPPDLVAQMVNAMLGLLIFLGIVGMISRLALPKRMNMFHTIIEGMRRLAQGDFNVSLDLRIPPNNQFSRIVATFNDMAAQLGAMEKMRQEFIANVSHEIQSPLTSIGGFARALRDGNLSDEERSRYLDIIETECMRLSRLSDNLLKLTSLESEHHPFERKKYRLDRQLREALLACEPQWLDKSIAVEADLEEAEVEADPELMEQVWGNLLHNSIKFTPPGGAIRVSLRLENGEAAVRVADTGIGIGPEDLPRIFERFYKADKSRNRSGGGSGLGLSIVKKIVDMHQGTIDVRSRPGEGTEFTVRLPAGPRDDGGDADGRRRRTADGRDDAAGRRRETSR
jgi:signal transduction histidine kinase